MSNLGQNIGSLLGRHQDHKKLIHTKPRIVTAICFEGCVNSVGKAQKRGSCDLDRANQNASAKKGQFVKVKKFVHYSDSPTQAILLDQMPLC